MRVTGCKAAFKDAEAVTTHLMSFVRGQPADDVVAANADTQLQRALLAARHNCREQRE
jgi:hypothetical protein